MNMHRMQNKGIEFMKEMVKEEMEHFGMSEETTSLAVADAMIESVEHLLIHCPGRSETGDPKWRCIQYLDGGIRAIQDHPMCQHKKEIEDDDAD